MLFVALCLTVMVLCWAATTAIVTVLWPAVRRMVTLWRPDLAADCIFLLQILPLVASAKVVSLFVIPSFTAWEPDHTTEQVSIWLASASLLAIALLFIAVIRLSAELRRQPVIRADKPFVAVLGCLRQQIVVNARMRTLLSEKELQAVLRHEAVHIARRDNLRLLVTRFMSRLTLSPRCWKEMEAARTRMTEFAADASAATDQSSALDLAQALVKVARDNPATDCRFASSLVADESDIQERVLRLLKFAPSGPATRRGHLGIIAGMLLAIVVAAFHHDLQFFCYQLLEVLVAL